MTKSKNILSGNGKAFDGTVPYGHQPTFEMGKICKQCGSKVQDRPSNKQFCDNRCRDDFHNNLKKEERQKLETLKLKNLISEEENRSIEIENSSQDKIKKKADLQLHFQSLNIPEQGLIVDTTYLNKIGFEPNLFDKKIELRYYPGYYLLEYQDVGVFWISAYEFLIANKIDYISWI